MTENDPPMAAAASNGAGTGGNGGMTDGTMARGIPYYEKLRRELRDTIQRKRLLDKNLVSQPAFSGPLRILRFNCLTGSSAWF
jgi:chromatin modification-related protein EAF6